MKKLILLLLFPALLQAQNTSEWLTPIANIGFEGAKIVYSYNCECQFDNLNLKKIYPDYFISKPLPGGYGHCREIPKYKKTVLAYLSDPSTSLQSSSEKIRYIKTFALQTLWAINGDPLPAGKPVEIIRLLAASPGKETSHTASVALKLYDKIKTDHSATNISTHDYANPDNTKIKTAPLFSNQLIPGNPPIKSANSDSVSWPKLYGEPNRKDQSFGIVEAYDNGYYILGYYLDQNNYPESTWLIKTDVNGNILWDKILISGNYNKPRALEPTIDGGLLICGSNFREGSDHSEPFVLKLNACGVKEWCKGFTECVYLQTPTAFDIKETPSGDIIVLVNQYGEHPIETMHLFKLNSEGEVLWRNPYASADNHPGSINPMGQHVFITTKGDYLIAGNIYWQEPWNPGGVFILRPMFTMVDSMGIEKWVLPFGLNDTIYGEAYNLIEKNDNEFLAVASKWPNEQQIIPMFISFDAGGNILNYKTLDVKEIDSTFSEGHFGYIIQQDTNFFLTGSFEIGTTEKAPIINVLMDTNIFDNNPGILSRAIYQNHYWPYSSTKTTNGKFLNTSKFVTNGEADISLSKVNSMLDMDTLDPGNYTYDSLCTTPGLPQSGFISLDDCDLFTDIGEIPTAKQYREKIRWIPVTAYPNPVTEGKLTLEFENTEHHQNMELRCYDDFGRQVHSRKIYKGQQDTDVDVSGWPSGIYIAVVYSDSSARGKAKFVVR